MLYKLYNAKQAYELSLLAITVWREARGEGFEGMLAVAWSIRNRVKKPGKKWWGNDWEEVVLKRWQYEANLPERPNLLPGDPDVDKSFGMALAAAEDAYNTESGPDPVAGATHYYAWKLMPEPAWVKAKDTKFVRQIGGHRFYIAS